MFENYIIITLLIVIVKSEGYYCPYIDLGANGSNDLLYDYYETNSGYWTRTGETGWQTLESYCEAKGDLSQHSDAGEWKCNDSFMLCSWNGSSCIANRSRQPDCKELCQAILDNKGPECLGSSCPNGGSDENMHMVYCGWSIPKYNEGNQTSMTFSSSTMTSTSTSTIETTTFTDNESIFIPTTETTTTFTDDNPITQTTTFTTETTTFTETESSTTVNRNRNRRCFIKRRN